MKIKVDVWISPEGHDGTGPDKAKHIKGSVEVEGLTEGKIRDALMLLGGVFK